MKKEFEVKLDGTEWEKFLDEAFKTKIKDVKVDGFRKGNVPKDIYLKKFGIESLFMDAADAALPTLYRKLMDENKDLEPAVMPTVDIKNISEQEIVVTFNVVTKPEVKLGKYKDLKIKKEKIEVTDEEIEHELGHLKEQFIEIKVKEDGVVADGDEVKIDVEGFKDGVAFEGGKSENYRLVIGSHSFIPGFEEGIIGMKVGEEKELNLKFPEDYHAEELKGKDVVFKVKVNEISERVYPEMNDDFFKDLAIPEVDSEEKLRNFLKNNIKTHKETNVEGEYVEKCLETATKNATFEVPEEMVNEEVNRMYNEFSEQIKMQGIDINTYLQIIKMDENKLKENFKEEATKRVSYRLVIEAVVKAEKFDITDEELDKHIKDLSKRYGTEESEFLTQVGGRDFVKYDLEFKKAIELITK